MPVIVHVARAAFPVRSTYTWMAAQHMQRLGLTNAGLTAGYTTDAVLRSYNKLVNDGTLNRDLRQVELAKRLDALLQLLGRYSADMGEHERQAHDYQTRLQARLTELELLDRERLMRQAAARSSPSTASQGTGSTWYQWLVSMLNNSMSPDSSADSSSLAPTPEQKLKQLSHQRMKKAREELGGEPQPPTAPKGLYIHGTVGSGKSLLMDLFYQQVHQGSASSSSDVRMTSSSSGATPEGANSAVVPFHRRLHFNAAMLEIQSRWHVLERNQQRSRLTAQADRAVSGSQVAYASQDASVGEEVGNITGGDSTARVQTQLTEAEAQAEAEDEAAVDAVINSASRGMSQADRQQVKQTRAALLSVRRHLRQVRRSGWHQDRTISKANSEVMQLVASSFVRGRAGDVSSGWGLRGRTAAVLCFDEMQVTDVFSAAALRAVFQALFQEGCILVLTSNRPPSELPRHGLNEDMFDHFIQQLHQYCDVWELSSESDYRRAMAEVVQERLQQPVSSESLPTGTFKTADIPADAPSGHPPTTTSNLPGYLWPLCQATDSLMEQHWAAATQSHAHAAVPAKNPESIFPEAGEQLEVPVMFGRVLTVPRAANGVAWFKFEDLCAGPLGAADYVALSQTFHTVLLSHVPAMSMQVRDQARRFITLIDELYNARVRLVCSAACPPDDLFCSTDEPILDLEGLQFETAVEDTRLRTNVMAEGGVAPVAASEEAAKAAAASMGGAEEQFAFKRAVSRLYEMQSPLYLARRVRG